MVSKNRDPYDKMFWTITEAAEFTGLGASKIRELTKKDDCDFTLMIGRKVLVRREDFIEYLKKQTRI